MVPAPETRDSLFLLSSFNPFDNSPTPLSKSLIPFLKSKTPSLNSSVPSLNSIMPSSSSITPSSSSITPSFNSSIFSCISESMSTSKSISIWIPFMRIPSISKSFTSRLNVIFPALPGITVKRACFFVPLFKNVAPFPATFSVFSGS